MKLPEGRPLTLAEACEARKLICLLQSVHRDGLWRVKRPRLHVLASHARGFVRMKQTAGNFVLI